MRRYREKQYGKSVLHTTGGKLFCSICNVTIDHTRKGTIDSHLDPDMHAKKCKNQEDVEIQNVNRQETVAGLFKKQTNAKSAQHHKVFELVQVFACRSKYSIGKAGSSVIESLGYLQTKLPNLGLLPSSRHLRGDYLDKVLPIINKI